ncbi:hypothetical protein [Thiothrix lacustris]|uniref:hypothetical protein n=1 Tax=Thiothrix lacustris TaxID=525917 RepID=UPI0027E4E563|nr:hypothetical protein [Thiothrix lacustris]WMP17779.1 hypothetical protein RCS87_01625 [Thiothrix lacustris]
MIVIPDAKKYAGDMETFKKLTGRDKLPYEEKHVQRQRGTDFTSDALVMVTGNGDIKASDTSSGVLRRRLKVKFNRIVPDAEKTQYGVGGIGAVLEAEMPGIVNWALSIGTETALGMLRNPGKRMQALAEETARNNDPVLEWLTTSCVQCKPDEETPIGRLAGSSTASIPAIGLYPNFVDYCEGAGIHKIPSVATFTHNILDHCNRHGIHAEHKKVVARSSALRQKRIIVGVRLRTSDDEAADSDDACRGFFGDAL